MKKEWVCEDCDKYVADADLLHAPNPFEPEDEIVGCPHCKGVGPFTQACDEDDCKKNAGCGWPSPDGYRNTCYEHWNKE